MGNFDALYAALSEDPRVRGTQFEHVCKWFLENSPKYRDLVSKVWLWNDWEHKWGTDAGIDLVVEDVEGRLWAVQAKAYAPSYSVTKKDVDKFLAESSRARAKARFDYRLLIATTDKLHHVARDVIGDQEKKVGFVGLADLLTTEVDWPARPDALRPLKRRKPATPHDYQTEAIRNVAKGFNSADRGQLIMACGTGKTLTSLFIKERLNAERVLVLLPSLSLLKQTMAVWRANSAAPFRALAVCSDETVKQNEDEPVTHTSELGIPDVTTDPAEVAAFLRRRGQSVVFATYHSSRQLTAAFAIGRVPQFDIAFADEAHRVAGDESSVFATILNSDAIKARRRLFMTATPRYFTGRVIKKAQESDEMVVASMDDHTKFGEVFHKLSFGEAISRGLLTDYQVAVIGVDSHDPTYREWADKGTLLKRDGKATDGRILASQIGLAKALREYDLRRVISFHSTIARARQFAAELPDVIEWMPKRQRPTGRLWTGVATGEMSAGERSVRLQRLRQLDDDERGLLTNARCLSEGVDVPTLDGVAFIDPKGSVVDIIQAVGRAIRLSVGKDIGTIVIPVFIDSDQDPAGALNDSSFKAVWRVVNALRAHDEELAEQIDTYRRELGRRGGKARIPDKIHLDVTRDVSKAFSDAFDVRLVEQTSADWEWWCGLLERYVAENNTARVKTGEIYRGHRLGQWVIGQRTNFAELSEDRRNRLLAVPGWITDVNEMLWEEGISHLEEYIAKNGHARVPAKYVSPDGHRLGKWVSRKRSQWETLSDEQQKRLSDLPGWTEDPLTASWEKGYRLLVQYAAENNDASPPRDYKVDGFTLGNWVSRQRRYWERLPEEQQNRLNKIDSWSLLPAKWNRACRLLEAYAAEHGTASVTRSLVVDGFTLGRWAGQQRQYWTRLTDEQRARLEVLPGWSLDVRGDREKEAFQHLLDYVAEHGTISRLHRRAVYNGYPLGDWITGQMTRWETLGDERRKRLSAIPGWTLDKRADRWEEGFSLLQEYVQLHGTSRVPRGVIYKDFKLATWVARQRRKWDDMSQERQQRLLALPDWTNSVQEALWDEGYAYLLRYLEANGDADVPVALVFEGFKLGPWVAVQRGMYWKGEIRPDREAKLKVLHGWLWRAPRGFAARRR
jgi:superfamily II DNA or RNA helicase